MSSFSNESEPLVSVLIATYNQKDLLIETLESVVAQTYGNYEVIVSDDCSTDGSQEILRKYASSYPFFRVYFQKENLGITGNYNFLADCAKGDFVSTFSGDDIMLPNKLEAQVEALKANPGVSFCHHAVYDMDSATGKVRGVITHSYKDGITRAEDVLRNMGVPGSMSVMYRRESAPSPVFEPSIGTASDWLNLIDLAMNGGGVYIDVPLCFYRKDGSYNKKDPTKYENDFVRTIEIARDVYGGVRESIKEACDYALARFYLGAGYRRLMRGDLDVARLFLNYALREKSLVLHASILSLFTYIPASSRVLWAVKGFYKRISRRI